VSQSQFSTPNNNRNTRAVKAASRVLTAALPQLLEKKGWKPQFTAATVALSSADTQIVLSKPLPTAVSSNAASLGLKWLPNLLSKNAHRSPGRDEIGKVSDIVSECLGDFKSAHSGDFIGIRSHREKEVQNAAYEPTRPYEGGFGRDGGRRDRHARAARLRLR
jgi:hypothetical protein